MSSPDIYDIEINYSCSNDCIACPKDKQEKILPFSEAIDFIRKNSGNNSNITITGGEPTLHPDFISIADFAVKSGATVTLLTNARKFSDMEFARETIKIGIKHINIPVYGPNREIHEQLTQSGESFQETVKGIKNLFQLKSEGYSLNIILKLLLCRINAKYFPDTIRFILEEFCPPEISLMIQPMYIVGKACQHKHNLLITLTELMPYITKAIEIGRAYPRPVYISLKEFPVCIFPTPDIYYRFCVPPTGEMQSIYGPDRPLQQKSADGMTVKSSACAGCERDKFCNGVWRSYGEMVGLDELKPIKRLKFPRCIRKA